MGPDPNDRLICTYYFTELTRGIPLGFTRTFAIASDGSDHTVITERNTTRALGLRTFGGGVLALDLDDKEDRILMTKQWVKEYSTMTRLANEKEGLGIEEVDIRTAKRRTVEQPDPQAIGYIADENGKVRLKIEQPTMIGGMMRSERLFYFRLKDSMLWKLLSRAEFDGGTYSGLIPVAVDSEKNIAYAFGASGNFEGVYTIPLVEGGMPELLVARDDVDVDQLIRIGRQARVVGASYATEKRQIVYFDPELKALAEQLQSALPNKPLINVVDASSDERKLLLIASSDTDPGMTYLYDKDKRQLEPLLPLREHLANRNLGQMTPVTFGASDGTQIPGYLTLPPDREAKGLPAIVLPHGGPSARDEWGFDWLVQFFVARGYAVLQPNYRGSTGYGAAWFGRNGFQSWETAIGDVNDAGRWLVSEGIADPSKLAIVGWSYGGYAALQSQVKDASLYNAVVAIAPVTDLLQLRSEAERFTNARLVKDFIGEGPHVTAGSPARNAERFVAPVLMFHGNLDQNVDIEQSRTMRDRLRSVGHPVTLVEFENETHSLDNGQVRFRMLKQIDEFLSANLGK